MSTSFYDMIIMCMILSLPGRSAAPLKIGGSLMYVHATGTIADPGKLEPYWPEETRVLAELHAEGVVKSLFRLSDRLGVSLRDRLNGHEYTVRSRYLVGADGARSAIAEELGLPIEGVMGRVGTIYTLFKADLTRYGDPDVEVEIEIATT